MSARKTCGGCRHYDNGECGRYPPQIVPQPNDNQHPVIYWPTAMRPYVGPEHPACGEFKS